MRAAHWKLSRTQFCEVPYDRNTSCYWYRPVASTNREYSRLSQFLRHHFSTQCAVPVSLLCASSSYSRRTAVQNCTISCSCRLWNVRIRFRGQLHIPAVCGYTLWLLRYSRPLGGRPSLKYGDSGHQPAYTASQRRRYLAPSFSLFHRFQSPLSLSTAVPFFLFRIPFLVSLYTFGGVSHSGEGRIPLIHRGFPYYLQPPSCALPPQ